MVAVFFVACSFRICRVTLDPQVRPGFSDLRLPCSRQPPLFSFPNPALPWSRSPCWFSSPAVAVVPVLWSVVVLVPRSWVSGSVVRGGTVSWTEGLSFEVGFDSRGRVPDFHAIGVWTMEGACHPARPDHLDLCRRSGRSPRLRGRPLGAAAGPAGDEVGHFLLDPADGAAADTDRLREPRLGHQRVDGRA